ncbi:MAG TPA: rRNA maturation RNase YbeY [Rhodocyclaceae bacterium]|nr:rRNA maturation RNase YbeY [Rhodocyclaceae bacterium]
MTKLANKDFSLTVQYACNETSSSSFLPERAQLRRWVGATLECPVEVTLRFVDAEEGRTLNRQFRGRGKGKEKDYPTNVLTFVYTPPPHATGDLVLCVPVVLREAAEQEKHVMAHFAHLVVHGMLHLQGYEHDSDADAERMEARECVILRRFGITDPYAGERNRFMRRVEKE